MTRSYVEPEQCKTARNPQAERRSEPEKPFDAHAGGSCSSEAIDPDDDRRALQLAADALGGGYWWKTQPIPSHYADAILMLGEAIGPQRSADGEFAISLFESSMRVMNRARSSADPEWTATYIDAPARRWRLELERQAARLELLGVSRAAAGELNDQSSLSAVLEARLNSLAGGFSRADEILAVKNAKLGEKIAQQVPWSDLFADKRLIDPQSQQVVRIGTGAHIVDYITRLRSALRLAAALETEPPQMKSSTLPGQVADAAAIVSTAVEGVAGLAGVALEGYAWIMRREALQTIDAARRGTLEGMASSCLSGARAIAASRGLSGALSAIDLVRHTAILIDEDSTDDERLESAVGALTAAANLGAVAATTKTVKGVIGIAAAATLAKVCLVVAIAVPVGWFAFRQSMFAMHNLRLQIAASMLIPDMEKLIALSASLTAEYEQVVLAQVLLGRATTPERQAAFADVVQDTALWVSAQLRDAAHNTDLAWNISKRELALALSHPGASGQCRDPQLVGEAINHFNRHISWCLENATTLVQEGAGVRGPPDRENDRPADGRS